MKRAVMVLVLGVGLIGLTPGPSAEAVVTRHWGQAINVYNARLFACKAPVRIKHGIKWRINLRAANHGRVKVVASAKVIRGANNHNTVRDQWARTVQPGASTPVGHVFAADEVGRKGHFPDSVNLTVRRVRDHQTLTWANIYPRAIPRCDLAPTALSWQGAGPTTRTGGGRIQLCSNQLLDASGPTTRWRIRGDARLAQRSLDYQAKVARVSDGVILKSWSRTIPPGGYTSAGLLTQSMEIDPSTNSTVEDFGIAVHEVGTTDTSDTTGVFPINIC
jgi:hypothetical protein